MPSTLPAEYTATRGSLHRLAEHVLAPARYASTERIGLRPSPGGIATPPFGETDRVVAIDGLDVVVIDHTGPNAGSRRAPITTVADAARVVGIAPGAPEGVYRPSTPLEPDAPLPVDRDAVDVIAMWYELTSLALRSFAMSIADDDPSEAQLWPEHFDLALSADRINYGGSPGDEYLDMPYLYVGPFEGRPARDDPYWNQTFGAAIGFDAIATIDDAFAFFRRGRSLVKESRKSTS